MQTPERMVGLAHWLTDEALSLTPWPHDAVDRARPGGATRRGFSIHECFVANRCCRLLAALVLTLLLLSVAYALARNANITCLVANGDAIGGWVLVASAFFARYSGMALVVSSSWRRTFSRAAARPDTPQCSMPFGAAAR